MTLLTPVPFAALPFTWTAARPIRPSRARQALYLVASGMFYFSVGATLAVLFAGVVLNGALLDTFKYLPPLAASWRGDLPAGFAPGGAAAGRRDLPLDLPGAELLFDQYRGENLDPSLLEFSVLCPNRALRAHLPCVRPGATTARAIPQQVVGHLRWCSEHLGLDEPLVVAGTDGKGINWSFELAGRGSVDV
jgi:hypothetical protein